MIDRRFLSEARIVAGVVGALAMGIAATSCVGSTETTVATEPPSPLEVEFSGCAELWAGTICELPEDGKLRLWTKAAPSVELTVRADGAKLAATRSEVQDGAQLRVSVPAGARALSVTRGEKDGAASFTLKLSEAKPIAALVRAEKLRQNGRFDEASAEIAKVLDDPAASVRARALGKAARIAFARGDVDGAVKLYGDALSLDREAGLVSGEVEDRFGLAYTLLFGKRSIADVEIALGPVRPLAEGYPDGRVKADFNDGQLAQQMGDLGGALRLLRGAERGAERLGLGTLKLDSQTQQLILLHSIGQDVSALRTKLAAFAITAELSACKEAEVSANLGWSALPQNDDEVQPELAEDAARWLEKAVRLYRSDCPKPYNLVKALENLAEAELSLGLIADAQRHAAQARGTAASPNSRAEVVLIELEGRIELRRGDTGAALRSFDRLAQIAASAQLVDKQLKAARGQAEVFEALDQPERAHRAYDEAERLFDASADLVPPGRERAAFLASNAQLPRHHLDFLIRRGTSDEAAEAARRSRSRALVGLRWIDLLTKLPPAARRVWYDKLNVYEAKRADLDAVSKEDWKLSAAELADAAPARAALKVDVQAAFDDAIEVISGVHEVREWHEKLKAYQDKRDALEAASTEKRKVPPDALAAWKAELQTALDAAVAALPSSQASVRGASAERALGALSQPAAGDLFLVFHPIRDGWAGFALSEGRPSRVAVVLPAADDTPEQIASDLLAGFEADIEDAAKIRFLPCGTLEHVDFHALPWKDRRLLAVAPIEYGLDVPGRGSRSTGPHGPAALVIADPSSNLFEAHQEGLVAADWLSGGLGFGVQRLDGQDATFSSVRRALHNTKVDHLHYAGHGHFNEQEQGETRLPLADGGALTLNDILTLEHTPRTVVLSGCETARTASNASAEGLGLAQAFVVRGADVAIAATTEVDDQATARIMATLYRALATSGLEDAAKALQTAELEELGRAGGSASNAWSSFRVLVP